MIGPLAYWRGVPFHVSGKSASVGRRVVIDEYPLRDTPSSEDLGRKARRFALDGYVVGPDVASKRDALISAAETAGDGVLIHPDHGRLVVVLEDCDYSETHDGGGGLVTFRLAFVEAGAALFPTGLPAAASALTSAAQSLLEGALADLLAVFDAIGAAFQGVAAAAQVNAILDDLETALAAPLAILEGAYAINAAIAAIRADVYELVADVEALAGRVVALLELFDDGSLQATIGLPVFVAAAVVPGASPSDTQDRTNRAALSRYVSRACLAELGTRSQVIAETFTTLDEGEDYVARYSDACSVEELDEVSTSAETHAALVDLRAAVSETILAATADAPRLEDVAVLSPMSSIALAFDLYGDPSRGAEIVARNLVLSPLFTGGTLRVLSA